MMRIIIFAHIFREKKKKKMERRDKRKINIENRIMQAVNEIDWFSVKFVLYVWKAINMRLVKLTNDRRDEYDWNIREVSVKNK